MSDGREKREKELLSKEKERRVEKDRKKREKKAQKQNVHDIDAILETLNRYHESYEENR